MDIPCRAGSGAVLRVQPDPTAIACCAARITQGSSGLARIMARLPGGGPTRTSVTADNSDADTVRGSLDIRSHPGSTAIRWVCGPWLRACHGAIPHEAAA
jgi:hypothetical protein